MTKPEANWDYRNKKIIVKGGGSPAAASKVVREIQNRTKNVDKGKKEK